MSKQGIQIFADALFHLQQARIHLLELGSQQLGEQTTSGKHDIRLAQLLDDAKNAVKEEFAKITVEETDEQEGWRPKKGHSREKAEVDMKINKQQTANLLEKYISKQCWDVWDDLDMTSLAEFKEKGAWLPVSDIDVETAVTEVLDDPDIDGWPRGGCPDNLRKEIIELSELLAGVDKKKPAKKNKRRIDG